ncbi:zinc finger BED domain-containing protein 5-like [Mytilus trossulus]|uniref:zinc finger BED domain-containing protein 5-like n=1 Tax=Mytilus trossulus TaxID=6551 RepID=UPI0030046DA8
MCRSEKFTVMIDESNDKGDNKKLNILVRVYNQTLRIVSTQFFGIPTCNIGTSSSIFNCLNQVFIDRDIPWANCIGFSSDNCNVMIGKNNSVLTRIQQMSPSVFNVGCVCHLANLCAQKAIKTLPLPVDDFLVDIYYHFHHSDRDIPWANCIGFSSDNCNVMIGKNNSVLTRIQQMSPSVFNFDQTRELQAVPRVHRD